VQVQPIAMAELKARVHHGAVHMQANGQSPTAATVKNARANLALLVKNATVTPEGTPVQTGTPWVSSSLVEHNAPPKRNNSGTSALPPALVITNNSLNNALTNCALWPYCTK
jgi:hypothetical protein